MIDAFYALWDQARPAFCQERTWLRARTLALSALVGMGRRTVTGMLAASAQTCVDWSAAYRLFEHERFDSDLLFVPARRAVCRSLGHDDPLVVMMDDTIVRKRGRRVHGTSWKRDPLGPPFCNNFIWGQRFLQLSAALPEVKGPSRARGVPIDLCHCPLPKKPSRRASPEQWQQYLDLQKTMKVSSVGLSRIWELRKRLDAEGCVSRKLVVAVDGTFTNKTVFRDLPANTAVVGRIRKDARIFQPPEPLLQVRRGRRRWYGEPLPSPEQIRKDLSIPWQCVEAWGSGQKHLFEIKTLADVRWPGAGENPVRLVVIRPLAYRPRKGARLLYRDPVYLVCSDPQLPLPQLLQSFLWRWEIEVNFRDEKTLLGMGEAQVRTEAAVESVPALIVAAYAFLLLASKDVGTSAPSAPKWRPSMPQQRDSTARLIGALRSQLWGKALGVNLTHVAHNKKGKTTPVKIEDALPSAVLYAFK